MNNSLPTIGERIYRFRKEKSFSQQDLEIEATLNLGSISRFESNQINPTKETLTKISKALNLTSREESYLLGLIIGKVSDIEINSAYHYVEQYFKNCTNPLHMSDDTWRLNRWNKKIIDVLQVDENFALQFQKICTIELLFHPSLPIRKNIPIEYWESIATNQVTHFRREIVLWKQENWYDELIKKLKSYDSFSYYWEKANKLINNIDANIKEKSFCLLVDKNVQLYQVADYRIDKFPRINLVEWIPISENEITNFLKKKQLD